MPEVGDFGWYKHQSGEVIQAEIVEIKDNTFQIEYKGLYRYFRKWLKSTPEKERFGLSQLEGEETHGH